MPREIEVKSVLNKTKKRDGWFLDDFTVNPYSGCSYNCLFCYIRGSKYGTHMEEKLAVKTNVLEVLEKQLANRAKKGQHGVVVLASATEPYLQFEEKYRLTRGILELLLKYRFPVHILTRSNLVTRDFDLLHEIDREAIIPEDLAGQLTRGAMITFSFSSLDDDIARIFEPGATPPSLRLETLKQAVEAKFLTGVSMMPLLPYITDTGENLHLMFSNFKEAGSHYLFPATVTLFGEGPSDSKTLVLRAVKKHFPHLLEKYEKFFAASHELPFYYRDAFYHKMQELSRDYGIKNRII